MGAKLSVILGGDPDFTDEIPLCRPNLADDERLTADFESILRSGTVTKGNQLDQLEREIASFLGAEHVVLVSSCTTGLLLTMRCLGLTGEVVLPSFTFMASGHALRWNGLTPVFADIDPGTLTLSARDAAAATSGRTGALLAVHTFGTPCDTGALAALAGERGIPLVVDAAPAFGGRYPDGSMIGTHGTAEVFSLSPTKPFTTGEGGVIVTPDAALARELRLAREYGNSGEYDSVLVGLNGRMPELSAALGRRNLPHLPQWLERRRMLADRYRAGLAGTPGISFQEVPAGALSTFKDLCLVVDPAEFGLDRDLLARSLRLERIATRNYFDPPLHQQTAYRDLPARPLPHTDRLSKAVISVPLYTHMTESTVDLICDVVRGIHDGAERIAERAV